MSDSRRPFDNETGGRLSSRRMRVRVTGRKRIRIDHQQIRDEIITISKIPLLMKEARKQRAMLEETTFLFPH